MEGGEASLVGPAALAALTARGLPSTVSAALPCLPDAAAVTAGACAAKWGRARWRGWGRGARQAEIGFPIWAARAGA